MNLLARLAGFLPEDFKHKLKTRWHVASMRGRLENLAACGFRPQQTLDVGAYKGEWSELCLRIFPQTQILLLEPQAAQAARLSQLTENHPNLSFEQILLANSPGEVLFLESESGSRIISAEDSKAYTKENLRTQQANTLDAVISNKNINSVDLLKVDAQGHELEILQGAQITLTKATVVILEVSVLRIGPVPIFSEILTFMERADFVLYDLCELNYRPLDGALWQVDAFFVKRGNSLLASRAWN